ncbi:MAG: hypothetical protein KGK16_03010 [Bradyrhizobium sp.]|nr:hypothetical protein [Bradyrhizobium sp.]
MDTMAHNIELTSITSQRLPGQHVVPVFQRPGPEVLSETIPVIFIGRNRDGSWVVRDAEARFGGVFWRKKAALDFAKANAWPGGYAVVFPQARFELDLENHGNPLIGSIGTVKRLLMRRLRRLTAILGRKTPLR